MHLLFRSLRPLLKNRSLDSIRTIARRMATALNPIIRKRLHVAIVNAEIVGAEHPAKTARKSVDNILASFLELYVAGTVDEAFIRDRVTFEGEEHFLALHESGQGYFITTAHLGSWELLAPILLTRYDDFEIVGLSRKMRNEKLFALISDMRTGTSGRATVLGNRNVTGDIAKALAEGKALFSMLDHTATLKDCIMVDFFGHKATFMAGVPAIAARKKVPVLMFYAIRTDTGIHVIFEPPVHPDMTLKPKQRIEDIARRINRSYEAIIRRYPEQWFLIHKRFNKVELPDGTISTHVYDTAGQVDSQ